MGVRCGGTPILATTWRDIGNGDPALSVASGGTFAVPFLHFDTQDPNVWAMGDLGSTPANIINKDTQGNTTLLPLIPGLVVAWGYVLWQAGAYASDSVLSFPLGDSLPDGEITRLNTANPTTDPTFGVLGQVSENAGNVGLAGIELIVQQTSGVNKNVTKAYLVAILWPTAQPITNVF